MSTAALALIAGIVWFLGAVVALCALGVHWAGKVQMAKAQASRSASIIKGAAVAAVALAVEAGELSEGQGAAALGVDRVTLRESQDRLIQEARKLYESRRFHQGRRGRPAS